MEPIDPAQIFKRTPMDHIMDRCDAGWVAESDGVRPCDLCKPGQFALWEAGFYSDRAAGRYWSEGRRREVFERGYRAIGMDPPPARKRGRAA